MVENFSTGYHSRNGGGDRVATDGHLPIVDLDAVALSQILLSQRALSAPRTVIRAKSQVARWKLTRMPWMIIMSLSCIVRLP